MGVKAGTRWAFMHSFTPASTEVKKRALSREKIGRYA
ncbi:hypothetical protein [Sporisorium scitamineum]|uniref:Uncharacterized protein n=1 Tax=Sporisorium scitamineum TaxID=49012 RepID=A0A0F7S4D0_9BASI|nr:hypothetical protein [Sporisorium scitamineum]